MRPMRLQNIGKAKSLRGLRAHASRRAAPVQRPLRLRGETCRPPPASGTAPSAPASSAATTPSITARDTNGRAASWIRTKSGASLARASKSQPHRIPAACAAGDGRQVQPAQRPVQVPPARPDDDPHRIGGQRPPPSGAASACRPKVHIVWARSRPARSPFPAATIRTAMRDIRVS